MTKAITHLSNVNAGDAVETYGVLPVAAGGTGRTDEQITQTITDGDTTHAPSGDAVFDALALKADDSAVVKLTGAQTVAGLKTLSENLTVNTGTLTPGIDIGNFGATKLQLYHDDATGTGSNVSVPGTGRFVVRVNNIEQTVFDTVGTYPGADNVKPLGSATFRWSQVHGGLFYSGGVQVVGARNTGWSAPTGTATKTTFDTATVTTTQLAERVKALTDALIAHGLIGT